MGNYGIAYLAKNGKGYSLTEPWIIAFEEDASKENIMAEFDSLKKDGCTKITLFTYPQKMIEPPENIEDLILTWRQVEERKVDIDTLR